MHWGEELSVGFEPEELRTLYLVRNDITDRGARALASRRPHMESIALFGTLLTQSLREFASRRVEISFSQSVVELHRPPLFGHALNQGS